MAAVMVSCAWLVARGRSSHDWNGMLICASWISAIVANCWIRNDSRRDAACTDSRRRHEIPAKLQAALPVEKQVGLAQLSQRDRADGCVRFGQKWKTGTGRQYFADIIGLPPKTVA